MLFPKAFLCYEREVQHHTVSSKVNHETSNRSTVQTMGLVDIHFHGAFGIDIMTASKNELNALSEKLWQKGIAGFCPTTLSTSPKRLEEAVTRLGDWIQSIQKTPGKTAPGALPLGIHLEGPYLNPQACGAHPPQDLRPLNLTELDALWNRSKGHLKRITLASEDLSKPLLQKLSIWARQRKIILSLGHSLATEAQAELAFKNGFTSVTHAWNAMSFHHRSPGILGAALGRPKTHVEMIIDGIHVHPTLLRWTLQLHGAASTCFISDCTPSAATLKKNSRSPSFSFGQLQVHNEKGASRLANGQLAGGGLLLPEAYLHWLKTEAARGFQSVSQVFSSTLPCLTEAPLRALRLPLRTLAHRQVRWHFGRSNEITIIPVDST